MVSVVLTTAVPSHAATTTYTRKVSAARFVSLSSIGLCAYVSASATATFQIASRGGGTYSVYDKRTLSKPKVTVSFFQNKGGCSAALPPKSVTKLEMSPIWYDYRCGGDLSYQASFPWSIGVGATYSCGKVERIWSTKSYGAGQSFSHTSESAMAFNEDTTYWVRGYGSRPAQYFDTCFRVDVPVDAYVKNRSADAMAPLTLCTRK